MSSANLDKSLEEIINERKQKGTKRTDQKNFRRPKTGRRFPKKTFNRPNTRPRIQQRGQSGPRKPIREVSTVPMLDIINPK